MNKKAQAFTIVELLIVIVVIAILAAISIAAYTNIQNRANDSVAKSDMDNVGRFMELYRAEKGTYPQNLGQLTSASVSRPRLTRGAYTGGGSNAIICVVPDGANAAFAFVATSKSGKRFYVTSTVLPREYTGSWGGSTEVCGGAGVTWSDPTRWGNWLTENNTVGWNDIFPG